MNSLEDLVLAHRFLYYVKCKPILSDREYDELEKEACVDLPPDSIVHEPGSDCTSDYSDRIVRLALDLTIAHKENTIG